MKKRGAIELPASGPAPQYPIESVDNALKIIHLLGTRSQLRLTEVAEALGVASSTAHRLLAMLQYRGFVKQDSVSKSYKPGTALSTVSFAILQQFDVRDVLHPVIANLNSEFGETVHLATMDGITIHFIDAIESPKAVRVASRLGKSMPANCTSSGKSMLASLSIDELHRLYPDEELEGVTDNSIRSRSELERELVAVRRAGYATSREESEEGVCSVAAAFPESAVPMHLALNVSVPASRMDRADAKRIGEVLVRTVNDATEWMP